MPSVERPRAWVIRFAATVRRNATHAIVGLTLVLCTTASTSVYAQEPTPMAWEALGGPAGPISHAAISQDGADVFAVAVASVHRTDNQTQWSQSGSASSSAALYHSDDGGMTWRALTNDLPPGQVGILYVDEKSGALFVSIRPGEPGEGSAGSLWRSDDAGVHWQQVSLGREIHSVNSAVRTADRSSLFLSATGRGSTPGSLLFRSNDDGKSWSEVKIAPIGDASELLLTGLFADTRETRRLYATSTPSKLLTSTDGGITWSVVREWPGSEGSDPTLAIPVGIRRDSGALFAASSTPEGIVVETSIDKGAHWTSLGGSGLPGTAVPRVLSALSSGVLLLNTDRGSYRSADNGKSWQPLEGPISSGTVSGFLSVPRSATTVIAATGSGLYVSRDAGGLWQALGAGLPANSPVLGLITDVRSEGMVYAILGGAGTPAVHPPQLMRSRDGGRSWLPAARGIPHLTPLSWAVDPNSADTVLLASARYFLRSTDDGLSWQITEIPESNQRAIAISPADTATIYLGGKPALRSTDAGRSWSEFPVLLSGQEQQDSEVVGLVIDPAKPRHIWAALATGGVVETSDAGLHWQSIGLEKLPLNALWSSYSDEVILFAGVTGGGMYRLSASEDEWRSISEGLPPQSTILSFVVDPRADGTLWASCDGGGIYRSLNLGDHWQNAGANLGDNLVQAVAIDYSRSDGVVIGTATAGAWALREEQQGTTAPDMIDARVELVWPHASPANENAELVNVGVRLFLPNSLELPACGWSPDVTLLQSVNTDPLVPVQSATQRTVDGNPFPFWEINDVPVGSGNGAPETHYFMVCVSGVETRTSVWAHGIDPRTYFPTQDVPSGLAVDRVDSVDARIQIVWPHDESGVSLPVDEGTFVNVGVTLFKHGTRLSVPLGWQPEGIALYGAWNQEIGRSLSSEARVEKRQSGAITYPQWQFDNIPVDRALEPSNKLFLWVEVEGVENYPTIWTHGADARTLFPVKDEPILGCLP